MASWTRARQNYAVQNLYDSPEVKESFPIELRELFAEWLEAQPIHSFDEEAIGGEENSAMFYARFIGMMEQKLDELSHQSQSMMDSMSDILSEADDLINEKTLLQLKTRFEKKYSKDPKSLVKIVRQLLNAEQNILEIQDSRQARDHEDWLSPVERNNIRLAFDHLHWQRGTIATQIQELVQQQTHDAASEGDLAMGLFSNLGIDLPQQQQHQQQQQQMMQQNGMDLVDMSLMNSIDATDAGEQQPFGIMDNQQGSQYQAVCDLLKDSLRKLRGLQIQILQKHLEQWKHLQVEGKYSEEKLHDILCELETFVGELASLLLQFKHFAQTVEQQAVMMPFYSTTYTDMENQFSKLIDDLIRRTFVVERQPPQILKTGTKFETSVRSLAGTAFKLQYFPELKFRCDLIDEAQARVAKDLSEQVPVTSVLLKNKATMQMEDNIFRAAFRSASCKTLKRPHAPASGPKPAVWEEKFCLIFQGDLRTDDGKVMHIRVMSVPMVVVVHNTQMPNAEATILWDNSFAAPNRPPFETPLSVEPERLGVAISNYFLTHTGRALDGGQIAFLLSKLELTQDKVSWHSFAKATLPQRNFTFWTWLQEASDMIRKFFPKIWMAGLVAGFRSKEQMRQELIQREAGTFAIRFSESATGGVSISWSVVDAQIPGNKAVWALEPWYAPDLGKKSLADRISDLPQLVYLNPGKPKDFAFKEYYSSPPEELEDDKDYNVRCTLVTVITRSSRGQRSSDPASSPPGSSFGVGSAHSPVSTIPPSPHSTHGHHQNTLPPLPTRRSVPVTEL